MLTLCPSIDSSFTISLLCRISASAEQKCDTNIILKQSGSSRMEDSGKFGRKQRAHEEMLERNKRRRNVARPERKWSDQQSRTSDENEETELSLSCCSECCGRSQNLRNLSAILSVLLQSAPQQHLLPIYFGTRRSFEHFEVTANPLKCDLRSWVPCTYRRLFLRPLDTTWQLLRANFRVSEIGHNAKIRA
jgi:hypothetical protein